MRLPAGWPRTAPFLVWSWTHGAWWRVDGRATLEEARASAAWRQANVDQGTSGDRRLGTAAIRPRAGARFVVTDKLGDPRTGWEAIGNESATEDTVPD